MGTISETQGSFFDPRDSAGEGIQQPSTMEELRQPTRRYLARLAVADAEPQQLEGMPQEPKVPSPELKRVGRRAALSPVMSPDYWGINQSKFAEVGEEDYKVSDPSNLAVWLHKRTDQSMRQTGLGSAWVLLSPEEKTIILNIPGEYAAAAEARYRTRKQAAFKSHDQVQQEALEEGAKAVEARLPRMNNLAGGYDKKIENLRKLSHMLQHPWMANAQDGYDVREIASTLRDGLRELITNIARVNNWKEDKLQKALTGLDIRLTSGDTRKRQQEKTAEWRKLTRLYGNYLLAKKVTVQNRTDKINQEIETRRSAVMG